MYSQPNDMADFDENGKGKPANATPNKGDGPHFPAKKTTVLSIDDDPVNQLIIGELLGTYVCVFLCACAEPMRVRACAMCAVHVCNGPHLPANNWILCDNTIILVIV